MIQFYFQAREKWLHIFWIYQADAVADSGARSFFFTLYT